MRKNLTGDSIEKYKVFSSENVWSKIIYANELARFEVTAPSNRYYSLLSGCDLLEEK